MSDWLVFRLLFVGIISLLGFLALEIGVVGGRNIVRSRCVALSGFRAGFLPNSLCVRDLRLRLREDQPGVGLDRGDGHYKGLEIAFGVLFLELRDDQAKSLAVWPDPNPVEGDRDWEPSLQTGIILQVDRVGEDWAVVNFSFRPFPRCRYCASVSGERRW